MDMPKWLQKLIDMKPEQRTALGYTDEDIEDAKKGYLRQDDYTKKTQEVAELRKIMDDNPGINARDAFNELKQLKGWVATEWPQFQAKYKELETAAKAPRAAANGNGNPTAGEHRWQGATVEDLYETERLQKVFGNLQHEINTGIDQRINAYDQKYRTEELPRLDKVAQGYMNTMLNLLRVVWPKDRPDLDAVLREAAAKQEFDFVKVAEGISKNTTDSRESIEKELRERWEKEAADKAAASGAPPASSSTGPLGGGTPTWKAPEKAAPKTRDQAYAAVYNEVSKKHGAPLPH